MCRMYGADSVVRVYQVVQDNSEMQQYIEKNYGIPRAINRLSCYVQWCSDKICVGVL